MTRHLTRRQAISGTAHALAVTGAGSVAGADQEPSTDAVVDADRDAEYPRCVYKLDDDGEWDVALPINIHARVSGEKTARSAVEDAFTGPENLRWTRVFPDSPAKAWDRDEGALVSPTHSFRRPRLGDEWAHVHVWDVDENRAAIHAHLDVVDLTASHLHRGDYYDDAAQKTASQLRDHDWQERTSYSIDYGLDDDQLEQWGATGDRKMTWAASF